MDADPTSKDELIDRVCRGVASIQEGNELRAYIVELQRRPAHETADDHEVDLANQLREVDRAYRDCLKERDALRAQVPASDYVLASDMEETYHKGYGQVLFATMDQVHAVETPAQPSKLEAALTLLREIRLPPCLDDPISWAGVSSDWWERCKHLLEGSPVEPSPVTPEFVANFERGTVEAVLKELDAFAQDRDNPYWHGFTFAIEEIRARLDFAWEALPAEKARGELSPCEEIGVKLGLRNDLK